MIMSDLFVKAMRLVKIKGEFKKIPVYGNFCPKCKTDSENIHGYAGSSLAVCIICNYVFTMDDVKKSVIEFLEKRNNHE